MYYYYTYKGTTEFYPSWPISTVRPNTFVHVDIDANLLFREYTADATAGISVGGCSIALDFSEGSQSPELLAAYVHYSGIQYVDDNKNLHACISANFFFSTKDLADKFVNSLPHEIHVYSNATNYKQRHFWKSGIDVYLLAKTREEYVEILNKMFAFPEARAHASRLFENHQLGLDRNVCSSDITSLNDSVAEFSETSTVVNSMAATSDSAPTTELISVFSGSKPDELVHLSPDEHQLPEASGDNDNSSEPISELIPEYHSKQSAVDAHGLTAVLGEDLLLGLDRNVCSNDITSLNDSVAEFSETSTVVNSMAATSDSAPTTELISVFSGSKPDELVHLSPDEHQLPEASGDNDNSSEPISELIPEYHSKQSAVDVHGLPTVLREGLLKNGIFSSEYSDKSNVNHAPHTQTETTVLVCDAICQIL
ncbi:hypothetical protein E4T54_09970 [Legionella geestiana]|uniref:hypothetical protein n=6 Tax=Legionella geestiana TaxID=45065 RepID=UPI000DFE337C|nr:hypothetical protein [Legionella geestiana]QBS13035.1 hypothetical protein E4T54_09970 [Legionella geestiana]STX54453.1 Uncharacterised protein [Legionella geestiana]